MEKKPIKYGSGQATEQLLLQPSSSSSKNPANGYASNYPIQLNKPPSSKGIPSFQSYTSSNVPDNQALGYRSIPFIQSSTESTGPVTKSSFKNFSGNKPMANRFSYLEGQVSQNNLQGLQQSKSLQNQSQSPSTQKLQYTGAQELTQQGFSWSANSPNNQHGDLQSEVANLRKELARQKQEKDEQINKLTQENKVLVRELRSKDQLIAGLQYKITELKRSEQERHQRRQQQREEEAMQRQYEFMMAFEGFEDVPPQLRNDPNNPNVDNMTYEELLNMQEQIGFVSKGMKDEDIKKIAEIKYHKPSMKETIMCSICQSDFENNDKIKKLNPCHHMYHSDCINHWLKNEKTCPICKQVIQV